MCLIDSILPSSVQNCSGIAANLICQPANLPTYLSPCILRPMQKNQRIILYILILIAGAAWIMLSANTTSATAGKISAPQAGFIAPDFTLKTPTGEEYTLSELKGKAVLVNLWATWCPPSARKCPSSKKCIRNIKIRVSLSSQWI